MSRKWEVEYTDELGEWWADLTAAEQESVDASVRLLEAKGPNLGFPHSSGIEGSKHSHMRELRVQHEGRLAIDLVAVHRLRPLSMNYS